MISGKVLFVVALMFNGGPTEWQTFPMARADDCRAHGPAMSQIVKSHRGADHVRFACVVPDISTNL